MRYVSSAIIIILFIVATIFGINLVRKQIDNNRQASKIGTQVSISDYKKTGTKLRLKISGPTVADENRQELVFEISEGTRSVKLFKGYNGALVKEQVLGNNYNAYSAFADALYSAGFSSERVALKDSKYQGECPTGRLFTMEVEELNKGIVKSLWKTSCTNKTGSLSVNYSTILNLFRSQFPDYKAFSAEVSVD